MTDETRRSPAETGSNAIEAIPAGVYWLIGKGRPRPTEPLYAVQFIDPESGIAIVETEAEDLAAAVHAAIRQLTAYQQPKGDR